jgi:hypothetical protein
MAIDLFFSSADFPRVLQTFRDLSGHDISRWALTGGIVIELHMVQRGRELIRRQLHDIDFMTDSFVSIPETGKRTATTPANRSTTRPKTNSSPFTKIWKSDGLRRSVRVMRKQRSPSNKGGPWIRPRRVELERSSWRSYPQFQRVRSSVHSFYM